MRAYSQDLRVRVLADCDEGMTSSQVAAKYRVSESWVRRLKQRRRQTGSITPKSQRYGPRPKWVQFAEQLTEELRQKPDLTLEELRTRLCGRLSAPTIWRALKALGLSLKKKS
jgi:transposase